MRMEKLKFVRKIFSFISFNLNYFIIFSKDEEIKRIINLLKDESSDHLTILEDIYLLLDDCLILVISTLSKKKKK